MILFVISIFFLYCSVFLLLGIRQTRLIFVAAPVLESTPGDADLYYEPLSIAAKDGDEADFIEAWWIPNREKSDATPVILFCHGNGNNLGDSIENAMWFNHLGWSSLLIDYRGYGNSQGPFPNEKRIYDDAEVAWHYLVNERNVSPQQIIVYGHSLGGAIAIELATRFPHMAGVIVEGTFTSILDMALLQRRYRLFPLKWILTQRLDNVSKVRSLSTPILFLHGQKDRTIPGWMVDTLFEAALEPKHKAIFPEAGHNSIALLESDRYLAEIQTFVQSYTAPQGS